MTLHRLHRIQTIPVPQDVAWAFFSDPLNLAAITPPWLDFRVTGPPPSPMYGGQILTYTVCPLPRLRMRWVTEISHVRRPDFFVDQQRLGPYRLWHHQHLFRSVAEGTEMEDVVHYALPFWPLGELGRTMVAARLDAIFEFRRQTLARMFGQT
ncbi:MAG: SRPBCC family protein [Desulfovibrionales bacterium]|nr:SRPBCC family protein [Desulfovibrionales bacterium]